MHKTSYYIINGITIYRVAASLILLFLLITNQPEIFKWFLAFSFFTDAIDGFLARRYKVVSVMGAKLDSIGDDLTVAMGVIGLIVYKYDFISQHYIWFIILLILFAVQVISAFVRYGEMTSFHTYLAKLAAVAQGIFLITAFFLPEPNRILFFIAIIITALDLIEEIFIVYTLKEPRQNVKGLYWINRESSGKSASMSE